MLQGSSQGERIGYGRQQQQHSCLAAYLSKFGINDFYDYVLPTFKLRESNKKKSSLREQQHNLNY